MRQPQPERVYVTVVEVNGRDSFPFHPSDKSSTNAPLLAKGSLCVTSVAKMLKEGFYLIIKQALHPERTFGDEDVPPPGCCALPKPIVDMMHLLVASLPIGRGGTIMPRQEPSKLGGLLQKSEHAA